MNVAIETDNLSKTYGMGIKAVDGVSFSVAAGEIFGFLGPNGAGKSTTIMMLTTLIRPTSGTAKVMGIDVVRDPQGVRKTIGYVSQDIAVDENLTGRENLRLQAEFYHVPRSQIGERIREVLKMVDLEDRADDLVSSYSGGMRKRLDIAEGLLHRPKVLFLDEPTLGLDIQTRRRIWDYVRRLRDEHGLTIFVTTHYMEEADSLCDRIAIIDHGKIVAEGSPEGLKKALGGDVISLKVRNSAGEICGDGVGRVIEKMPFVQRAIAESDGIFTVIVRDGEKAVPRLLSSLSESGITVDSITLKRASLDDVFLHYTGRELREDGGKSEFHRMRTALRRARK
ncbi:MAG TPA: ATP-binding cassette domain-containing protein [Clostridia bacterium]|nr:ATP-binding cassette domain-containing protein [Clostridia bacterium]